MWAWRFNTHSSGVVGMWFEGLSWLTLGRKGHCWLHYAEPYGLWGWERLWLALRWAGEELWVLEYLEVPHTLKWSSPRSWVCGLKGHSGEEGLLLAAWVVGMCERLWLALNYFFNGVGIKPANLVAGVRYIGMGCSIRSTLVEVS